MASGLKDPKREPSGAVAHPDHDGWLHWPDIPPDSFAGQTGLILFRAEGEGARVRMFPTARHLNMGGSIHGGAVMSFIDMALFAGGRCAGLAPATMCARLRHHFIARGEVDVPLDAVERGGQTRRHVFLSGHCEQGDRTTQFTGTLKRIRLPEASDAPTGPVGPPMPLGRGGRTKADPDQRLRWRQSTASPRGCEGDGFITTLGQTIPAALSVGGVGRASRC